MPKLSPLFSSASEHWATPEAAYIVLDAEFHFDFDPCPLKPRVNGLFLSWKGRRAFVNPPYGPGLGKWLKRGLEAELAVFLLPARTDTAWFHEIVLPHAKEIRFLRGRLGFGRRDGQRDRAPFPSMVVIFRGGDA